MPSVWDESKREANLAKHGLDFADAPKVFGDPHVWSSLDPRYSDDRSLLIGKLEERLVVVIAYTEPKPEFFRIISMRPATKREIQRYEQEKAKAVAPHDDPLMQLLQELERNRESREDTE